MATKRENMEQAAAGTGCLGKAHDDEPVFILRAQDRFAPGLVERWADMVEHANSPRVGDVAEKTRQKIKGARALAHQMRAWQELNLPKIPD